MISVCIPSRGPLVGLWATIAACELQLAGTPHEYIVVINGRNPSDQIKEYEKQAIRQDNGDYMGVFSWSEETIPPPIARNQAAQIARGEHLYFLDDHCIPLPGYFDHLPEDGEIVHGAYSANLGKYFYYHSKLNRQNPAKADYSREPKSGAKYPCISAPNGGQAMPAATWRKLGAYDDFWQGFGGEEVYIDLKAHMKGIHVFCDPRMKYFHFSCRPEVRGYDKTFNEWNFKEGLRRLKAGFPNQVRSLDEILDSNPDWL